ncbi:MAG: hypothetical protein KDB23_31115, partial [Planctomycetales bacterium]|nr:hypothetical protein [Planctomycetales bacterium]
MIDQHGPFWKSLFHRQRRRGQAKSRKQQGFLRLLIEYFEDQRLRRLARNRRLRLFARPTHETLEVRCLLATATLQVTPGDWTVAGHWDNGAPVAGDVAQIGNSAGVATGAATLNNGSSNSVGTIVLGNTASASGTLNVSGSGTVLNATTQILAGAASGTSSGTINVSGGGILGTSGNLVVGELNGIGGGATFSIDGASQLNVGDTLSLRGSGTYALPLASTPTNGKLSSEGLAIAPSTNNNVTLNATAAGGTVNSVFSRPLAVGTGNNATGVLNVDGVSLTGFNLANVGTGGGTSHGTINVRNGGIVETPGNLGVGQFNAAGGGATFSI